MTNRSSASATGIGRFALIAVVAVVASFFAVGCGDDPRQEAGVKTGTWNVSVVDWSFPKRQPLGTPVVMALTVRNEDARDIDHLAITITGLRDYVNQDGQAVKTRPVWIRDETSKGEQTPYSSALSDTFDAGPLAAGATTTFSLPVTPLRRGEHEIGYRLGVGVVGGGQAQLPDGSPAADRRTVTIDPTPNFDKSVFD
ncbi:MAG: hypothetical protein WAO61_06695 [Solirubrobacterales bacterium]